MRSIRALLSTTLPIIGDPERLLDIGVPMAAISTSILLGCLARLLVWPATCLHAGAHERAPDDGQVVALPARPAAEHRAERAA